MTERAELTLGAEEELHLIDVETRQLRPRAPQMLARLPEDGYTGELQRTTIETNTAVVPTLDDLRTEILRLRKGLIDVVAEDGLGVAAVGTAPRADADDFELSVSGRFGHIHEQYRLLVDEQLICGTQIHVGVSDRDRAVEIAQRVEWSLPVLLALSASSPFWNGLDTGYASFRTILWQRWPSAGSMGPLRDASAYDDLVTDLVETGVIADEGMAYFDVRPSSHLPTLELRILDACPVVDDAVLVAGLFRAAVRHAEADIEAGRPHVPASEPIRRAAIWQAARGGLSGTLFDSAEHPRPVPAADAVRDLVARLRPQLEEIGDYDDVVDLVGDVLARGNSADRQRAAFAERGELDDVVDLVMHETHGTAQGSPPDLQPVDRYRTRAGDEAIGPASLPRPAYREIVERLREIGDDGVRQRQEARDEWVRSNGLTFRLDGQEQPFPLDLVPRIINPHEWDHICAGLQQRARALESFLQDAYGEQRVVADGVLPADVVTSAPGWRKDAMRLPPGTVRATVMGFDLVRNETGDWRVLEDNVRVPSGAAFAMAAREMIDDVQPDLPRPDGLLDPRGTYRQLRAALLTRSGPEGTAALLTSGPDNSAWYEHRRLADGAGLHLVQADDIVVHHHEILLRDSGQRVDALYVRLDDDLVDLVDSEGREIGGEIFEAAVAGSVLLANAPGNGVADDKAIYCYIPELITYYLDESPILSWVPTYRPADASERQTVLERVPQLVTKPVDGAGGAGVLVGPKATAAEIAARRRAIAASPEEWIAQEVVSLSSHPSLEGTRFEPRHVDLRVFAYMTGTGPDDCTIADVALTRVAPAGSMVVNSSAGGGAKDTWIASTP
jgi:carboxylate-amine ligase